jgi:predicted transcriptional regulator
LKKREKTDMVFEIILIHGMFIKHIHFYLSTNITEKRFIKKIEPLCLNEAKYFRPLYIAIAHDVIREDKQIRY